MHKKKPSGPKTRGKIFIKYLREDYCFQVSALTVLSRPASLTVGATEEDAGGTIAEELEEGAAAEAVITSSISRESISSSGEVYFFILSSLNFNTVCLAVYRCIVPSEYVLLLCRTDSIGEGKNNVSVAFAIYVTAVSKSLVEQSLVSAAGVE